MQATDGVAALDVFCTQRLETICSCRGKETWGGVGSFICCEMDGQSAAHREAASCGLRSLLLRAEECMHGVEKCAPSHSEAPSLAAKVPVVQSVWLVARRTCAVNRSKGVRITLVQGTPVHCSPMKAALGWKVPGPHCGSCGRDVEVSPGMRRRV